MSAENEKRPLSSPDERCYAVDIYADQVQRVVAPFDTLEALEDWCDHHIAIGKWRPIEVEDILTVEGYEEVYPRVR